MERGVLESEEENHEKANVVSIYGVVCDADGAANDSAGSGLGRSLQPIPIRSMPLRSRRRRPCG